jgi:hypothetical protein
MKAIIHIGQSKAGSTSLQSFLLRNQEQLRQKNLFYLRNRRWAGPDIELLLTGLLGAGADLTNSHYRRMITPVQPEEADEVLADLRARITKCAEENPGGVFVASCEQLFLWLEDASHIRGLHDFLTGLFDDITYVCYLRRQEDWIASRYSQALRSGHVLTLGEHAQKQMKSFSAEERINLWTSVIGTDRLNLRLLESDWLTGGDLITDFLDLAGIENTGFEPAERTNESFTPESAEFARLINIACRNRKGGKKKTEELRRRVMRSLTEQSTGKDKLRLSPDQVDQVRARYADENARIAADWFPGRETLYPARAARADAGTADTGNETLAAIALELLLTSADSVPGRAGRDPNRKARNRKEAQQARKARRQAAK